MAFGPFVLAPDKRLLERDGVPVELGGRALDLLIALVARAGRVVSKRELLSQVWPDTVVEEGSLRFHMTGLRRALEDGCEGARYIATQVGVGYAFVAPLQRVGSTGETPAPALKPPMQATVGGLPSGIRLIGRDEDLTRVLDGLARPGLLTIVGAGGVGKTSLVIEVGRRIGAQSHDPVHFVDLAQVQDASLVPSALAGALGLPVQAEDPVFVLLAHLRSRRVLLIIDNCEHVVDAASGIVERIIDAAPHTGVLATSREPLRARGERLHWLGPLEFPAAHEDLSSEQLLAFPAVQLFVDRARAGNGALQVDAAGMHLVADMCRRLDGMALPIELAAMRVATHGIASTHDKLGESFSLGWAGRRTAQARQQTLRATLGWSYSLLLPAERRAFDRLAVFVGPFSQDAAAQVIADADAGHAEAAAVLDDLVAKGLVALDRAEPVHAYRLLEMTRAYARERLALRGEAEHHATAFRHAAYYLDLLADLSGSPEEIFDNAAQLGTQLGNVRSALEWSFGPQGDPGLALPLAAASTPLFLHFGLLVECRQWCERAIALLELGYFGTPVEMELQAALGFVLMFTRGNTGTSEKALLRAMDIAVALDDYWSQLRLLGRLQIFYERIGDFASSLAWAERAGAVGDATGETGAIAIAASLAGISHHLLGNQTLAREELEKALQCSAPSHLAFTIHYGFDHRNRSALALARTLWLQGHADQSRQWARKVEAEAVALGHPVTHCIALVWTLGMDIWSGDLDNARASLATFSRIAEANMFGPYIAASLGMRGAIAVRAGDPLQAIGWLEESLASLHGMRYELLTATFELALTEALVLAGRHQEAARVVDGTIAHCRRSGDAHALPELLRVRAGIHRVLDPRQPELAEAMLDESLTLSIAQGARAWTLRATMDRARVLLAVDPASALQWLRPWMEERAEGVDTCDRRELAALWHEVSHRLPA